MVACPSHLDAVKEEDEAGIKWDASMQRALYRFVHLLCQNGEKWSGIVVVWLGFPSSNHLVREVFRYSSGASARDVVKCSPGLIMHFDAWFELFLGFFSTVSSGFSSQELRISMPKRLSEARGETKSGHRDV